MSQKIPNKDDLNVLTEALEIIYARSSAIKILTGFSQKQIEDSDFPKLDIDALKENWVRETTENDIPGEDPHKAARVLLLYICKNYLNIQDEYIQSLILDPNIKKAPSGQN